MAIPVDSWYLGAGDIDLDSVVIGSTRENNVFRLLKELDAPIVNGTGGKLARTDYYVRRPYPQLEFTFIELSETSLPLIVPGAAAAAVGDDIVVTPPTIRRLGSADYHAWGLTVPGVDGLDLRVEIPLGINVNDAEMTAADSPDPLGPRLMIEGRFDPEEVLNCWEITLVDAALS